MRLSGFFPFDPVLEPLPPGVVWEDIALSCASVALCSPFFKGDLGYRFVLFLLAKDHNASYCLVWPGGYHSYSISGDDLTPQ